MNSIKKIDWKFWSLALLILCLLIIFAYGLKINHYGYLEDDWLTLFVTKEIGKGSLVYHYSFDRPLRGYYALALSTIYQDNMILYQISALFFRLLSAVFIMASLTLIWPKRKFPNLLVASLIVIYPVFFEQPHAFDYQAHLFSFFCMVLSIYLTVLIFYLNQRKWKIIATIAAILLAFASYGINDYFIGLEGLRMGLVFILLYQKKENWKVLFQKFALIELIYLLPGGLYSMWRIFIFESKRATTDASAMLSPFQENFIKGFFTTLIQIGRNAFKVVFEAWFTPIRVILRTMTSLEIFLGILMGLLITGLMIFWIVKRIKSSESERYNDAYAKILIVLGLFSVICTLVPIVFGMRFVDFTSYNRFSFPGSIGSAMVIVGLLLLIPKPSIRYCVYFILLTSAITMQYGNGLIYEDNYNASINLWHQLSWRAPDIHSQTLISGQIKAYSANEPYTFWSPASMIYYPDYHKVMITAEILNEETLEFIRQGIRISTEERGIPYTKDYSSLLLLDKPTLNSCIHVIDGRYPELSIYSSDLIRAAAPYSKIEGIDPLSEKIVTLDPNLFHNLEPEGWCYSYQKAQLARQLENWDEVDAIGQEVLNQELTTTDNVEWMPYIQAFAYAGDIESFNQVAGYVAEDVFLRDQACRVFTSYSNNSSTLNYEAGNELLLQTYCE